jgi:hypothetical protein
MSEQFDDFDFGEDDLPEGSVWCDRCQGSGVADCHCGGDQCYCENYGEMECPRCHGEGFYVPTPKQIAAEAEMSRIMGEALASVGRNAERQDRENGPGPKDEHAVTAKPADAQTHPGDPS